MTAGPRRTFRAGFPGLPGRYRIERELGRGAQKRVYLAHDDVLDRRVAIAAVDTPAAEAEPAARLNEARAMARLGDLSHVVTVYDVIDAGARLYIVSQYLPGGDLASHLAAATGGPLPVRRAVEVAGQICQALSQAHEHGICHRDVKPQNVFLDARGTALLGDFGLADIDASARTPAPARRVGTLAYAAPEQAWGRPPDPRGDLYSLGCVLYELLTGAPPFVADSPADLLYLHEHALPVPPVDRSPGTPMLLNDLVLRLLAKRPEERPASAADVRGALEGIQRALASVDPAGEATPGASTGPLFGRRTGPGHREPPFVGRGDELRLLEGALERARAGEPSTALLPGEPGAGKTRLLREFCRRAADAGDIVLVGQGPEDVRLPDQPFVEALLPLAARLSELGPDDARALRRFLQLEGWERPAAGAPPPDRVLLQRTVGRALARFSAAHTLVLAIDDLHWCDHASLDLFGHLALDLAAAAAVPRRILLLGTYRPPDPASALGRLLARLAGEPRCLGLPVEQIDENDVHALLEGLGVERPANQLVHLVHRAAGGNPLFAREVVRHLEARGEITRRGGFAVAPAGALELPLTAAAAVAGRVGELPAATRQLLAFAALVGGQVDLRLLAEVAETDEDLVVERLDPAVAAGLLADEGQAYAFAHPVIRQVCLALPSRTRRERMHLRIAMRLRGALESRHRTDVLPRVAHHLVRAGAAAAPALTCEFARRAATHAFERAAWHEAAELFDAALDAAARGDVLDAAARAELHRWAGYAYQQLSDEGPCFAHLDAAIASFEATGDRAGLVAVLSERARARVVFGKVGYAQVDDVAPLEAALAGIDDASWRLRAVALGALAVTAWAAGRCDRAEALADTGLALARARGDDRLCAELCWDLAMAQQQGGRLREALATCEAGLAHAGRAGVAASAATCLQRMPLVQFMLGRLDDAEATVREARDLHRTAFTTGDESVALAMLAALEATRGAFGAAERWIEQVMRLHERIGYAWGAVLALVTRAHAHAVRGRTDAAHAALDEMVRPGRIFDDPSALAATLGPNRRLVDAYAGGPVVLAGDPDGFLPAPAAEGPLDAFLLTAYCFQVELAAAAGRPDLAHPLEPVLAHAEERGIVFTIAWPFLVARIRGVAAALGGRAREADAHFTRAAAQAARCGAIPELGRTLLDHGRLLMARGLHTTPEDHERAAALLRRAQATLARCDMTGFAAQAEALGAAADPST